MEKDWPGEAGHSATRNVGATQRPVSETLAPSLVNFTR